MRATPFPCLLIAIGVLGVGACASTTGSGARTPGAGTGSPPTTAGVGGHPGDALLVDQDLPGWKFSEFPAITFSKPPVTPDKCQPLDDARTGMFKPSPQAAAARMGLGGGVQDQGDEVVIDIAVFEHDSDAIRIMQTIRQATSTCHSGFSSDPVAFTSVTQLPAPHSGDEAVAAHLNGSNDEEWIAVVRQGATLLAFTSDGIRVGTDRIPDDLIAAQVTKLKTTNATK